MPTLASLLGVIVSAGFIVAAGVMNWRFGLRLGRSPDDQFLFAAIAAGVDIMKVLLPFFIWWSLSNRRWIACLLSSISIVALMSYSVTGIAGFVELNRAFTTGAVATKKDEFEQLRGALARVQAQRSAIGVFQVPEAVEERLNALQQDRHWKSSEQCTNATVAGSRSFCTDYHALKGEWARGREARRLDEENAQLRRRIAAFSTVRSVEHGDPRAEVISRLTGWSLIGAQTALTALLVVIVEGISTFGIFLSLNHGQASHIGSLLRMEARHGA